MEIELILKWSQNCALTEKAFRERNDQVACNIPAAAVTGIDTPSDLKFNIICSCSKFTRKVRK